jgi:lipid II:glycine glycyltransferase (peptidoglycan interpeptide bridge formation enzyme)
MNIDEQIEALRAEKIKTEAEIERTKIKTAESAAELEQLRKSLQQRQRIQRRRCGVLNFMQKGNA